jgi:hypothetical protein
VWVAEFVKDGRRMRETANALGTSHPILDHQKIMKKSLKRHSALQ